MESNAPCVYLLGKTYLTNNEEFYIQNDSITFGDNSSG